MLASLARGQHLQRVGLVQSSAALDEDALLEKSCRAGVGPACEWRAYRFSDDEHASRRAWLQRACDAGWGPGCHSLAMDLDATGARTAAIAYWEKACTLGLLDVCHDVGDILSNGDGVPDRPRARRDDLREGEPLTFSPTWCPHSRAQGADGRRDIARGRRADSAAASAGATRRRTSRSWAVALPAPPKRPSGIEPKARPAPHAPQLIGSPRCCDGDRWGAPPRRRVHGP